MSVVYENPVRPTKTVKITAKDLANMKGPKRLDGEDFKKYKIRRKIENYITKIYCRGSVFHNSRELGTYTKGN